MDYKIEEGVPLPKSCWRSKSNRMDIILKIAVTKNFKRVISDKIKPEDNPKKFLSWILKRKEKRVLVVSHEPFMSLFLKSVTERKIQIKKGNILVIQVKNKKFKLLGIY